MAVVIQLTQKNLELYSKTPSSTNLLTSPCISTFPPCRTASTFLADPFFFSVRQQIMK